MNQIILNGILLDEETDITLHDLCRACASTEEWIIELVEEGVLEPVGNQQTQWQFSASSLVIARTATRLQQDLGINTAGIALVLDLMDEIETLQSRLHRFEVR
jgi:chaperone modulatory protein CbpM